MNNIKEVQLFKDDFRVILMALQECQTAWRTMIDEGELPDVPGLDMGKAHHILIRFSEVREKVQTILDGEPLKVDGESVRKILDIIKENGAAENSKSPSNICPGCCYSDGRENREDGTWTCWRCGDEGEWEP
jgi:hypothetical protein